MYRKSSSPKITRVFLKLLVKGLRTKSGNVRLLSTVSRFHFPQRHRSTAEHSKPSVTPPLLSKPPSWKRPSTNASFWFRKRLLMLSPELLPIPPMACPLEASWLSEPFCYTQSCKYLDSYHIPPDFSLLLAECPSSSYSSPFDTISRSPWVLVI